MPLYEYQCEACGHRFEVIQKFSDAPLDTCPKCGGRVGKLLSSPAIQFKGSGWYITDYARAGKANTGQAPKEGGSSGEKGGGETKPAGDGASGGKSDSTPSGDGGAKAS
ncbi:MAG: FmdB family zinc ribbon protein [Vicinamibacterales bacterium]